MSKSQELWHTHSKSYNNTAREIHTLRNFDRHFATQPLTGNFKRHSMSIGKNGKWIFDSQQNDGPDNGSGYFANRYCHPPLPEACFTAPPTIENAMSDYDATQTYLKYATVK